MAVYQQNEYEKIIERIKKKIKLNGIVMGDILSEETIRQFENKCHVCLPEAYRLFLQKVGDGCKMIDGFYLKKLCEITPEDLSVPFMMREAWVWEEEDIDRERLETTISCGNIELIDIGDGMSYHLIVSGGSRGEVWNFTDVGVQPCCERQDFFGWFELWLDEQEDVDYFKDYCD